MFNNLQCIEFEKYSFSPEALLNKGINFLQNLSPSVFLSFWLSNKYEICVIIQVEGKFFTKPLTVKVQIKCKFYLEVMIALLSSYTRIIMAKITNIWYVLFSSQSYTT
jgi:hypothetical protein